MTTVKDFNSYGEELERILMLKTSPIAVKMLEKEEDIPAEAIRPKRDRGYHLAQCQAFALTRRRGETIAMLKEDNWCWASLIGYGLVKPFDEKTISPLIYIVENMEAAKKVAKIFPRLEYGKYIGILSAPLKSASFEPDLVLVYSNTAQLRSLLMAVKFKEGYLVNSQFDPIDSCVYSVVPVMLNGQYRITLPDPGEYERAMAGEDEIILSVPADKMAEMMSGLKRFDDMKMSYKYFTMDLRPDFPRPDFYKELFKMWGLDVEE
ncbi:MAG TPA: DUF169 domain-containing protein [Dehalococcoidia bacterium]|nr:DUF169 domain-containing protein [Dehalococcoidia bacterium]